MHMGVYMDMGQVLAALLLPIYQHMHMGAGDPALLGLFGAHLHAGQPQGGHLLQKFLRPVQEFHQRGGEHISGRSHAAFQIECFHFSSPPI